MTSSFFLTIPMHLLSNKSPKMENGSKCPSLPIQLNTFSLIAKKMTFHVTKHTSHLQMFFFISYALNQQNRDMAQNAPIQLRNILLK